MQAISKHLKLEISTKWKLVNVHKTQQQYTTADKLISKY